MCVCVCICSFLAICYSSPRKLIHPPYMLVEKYRDKEDAFEGGQRYRKRFDLSLASQT